MRLLPTSTYRFNAEYAVEANSEKEAFDRYLEAIEQDIAHYRKWGYTQIEWTSTADPHIEGE